MHEALQSLGDVDVVAPESPQSAAGHAITLHGPVSVRKVHVQDQFFGFSVDGRPADCVKLGISQLIEEPPDLVVSGINDGANVSINVLYSGTVAAAAEGALMGYPAIAVSMEQGDERDFNRAATLALPIIRKLVEAGLGAGELVNINIPDLTAGPPKGVRVVPMATRTLKEKFVRHAAPDGRDYYWLTSDFFWQKAAGFTPSEVPTEDDVDALDARCIAVTPLHFDLTRHDQLARLAEIDWPVDLG
jgi:5'-nucleotidase